ncbi:MAG: hypothetical protein ACLRP3_10950 [Escherichia sp.]
MLVANFGADELNAFTEHHFWLALRNKTFTIEWQEADMSDRRHAVGRQSCDADFTDWYTVDAKN